MLTIPLLSKAHHASNEEYSVVTADRATIKVWIAQRTPSHPQGQVSGSIYRARSRFH